jgi:hypothetical protein
MASSINALTSSGGGVVTTADSSGELNLQSNGTTVAAVSSTGVNITGTINASGAITSTGQIATLKSGTAQNTTSGTSIDFTGIPSWAKRITVMLANVSLNSAATTVIRLGTSSGIVTTGYASFYVEITGSPNPASSSAGFIIDLPNAAGTVSQALCTINNLNGNTWVIGGNSYSDGATNNFVGNIELGSTLTQLRVTTTAGTATFDAGSINIMYE